LMVHYFPLVKFNADRVWAKLPDGVDLNDLISAGTFGLMDAIEAYDAHDFSENDTFQHLIAEGQKAVDGECEGFDLTPELQLIHDQAAHAEADQDATKNKADSETLDHRERSSFMIVKAGQKIGQLTRATDGTDGIDVCGNNIAAKPGTTGAVKLDQNSIEDHEDGSIFAKVAGQVVFEGDSLSISPTLTIAGAIDYSTGNIDFPGNITISKGIKDGFNVEAGKTITACGLVEAASLTSSRDVVLSAGMSGREKGAIYATRDLVAKYLDKCNCQVGRDLVIENDICDCNIVVSHDTKSPAATLMGGELSTLNECELGQVGTESGTKTIVTLGRVPEIDRMVHIALDIVRTCRAKAKECSDRAAELHEDPDYSPTKAEMLTLLQFEEAEHENKIKRLMESIRDALRTTDTGTPKLTVQKELCQNAEIRIGGQSADITQTIQGPISIWLELGEMVCKDLNTGTQVPLSQYATITKATDSYTQEDLPEDLRIAA